MAEPLVPILKPYEPPRIQSRRASPGFIAQLLDALVGQPGDPELARVAGKWQSDPAAVPWITLGYVSAVPGGFRKAFQANLAMAIGGVAALGGIFQAALEKPKRPGSI